MKSLVEKKLQACYALGERTIITEENLGERPGKSSPIMRAWARRGMSCTRDKADRIWEEMYAPLLLFVLFSLFVCFVSFLQYPCLLQSTTTVFSCQCQPEVTRQIVCKSAACAWQLQHGWVLCVCWWGEQENLYLLSKTGKKLGSGWGGDSRSIL